MQGSLKHTYANQSHQPVMLEEMLKYMSPKDGEVYIDGTFGAGGYTRALLKSANCKVYSIDRDPDVQFFADNLANEFPGRFHLLMGNFGNMHEVMIGAGVTSVDGVVLDIGVSSMQIDTPERGFSFSHDGPLDMRMEKEGKSAEFFINNADEKEIADVIYNYGGERMSYRIARAIINARAEKPITRTAELAEIIRRAVRKYNDKIDPATRTFQAIRIWVNDELDELARGLAAAEKLLAPGGRLVAITFHSLEDSIVKEFFNERAGKEQTYSRHQPVPTKDKKQPSLALLTKKAVKPSDDETNKNPRARSAKLRAAERTSAGTWEINLPGR